MFETSTPRPEKSPRHALRPVARALALEPRLLFDGAGAVAAADHFDAAGDHAAEAHKQDTQPAAEARPSETGRNAAGMELAGGGKSTAGEIPLLNLTDSAAPFSATLSEAARLALQSLESWLQSGDHLAQAAEIFSADAGSAAWNANFQALREELLEGRYGIRTEVRSAEEMQRILGAWSATGTTGERTLYLNADWLAKASAAQVQQVLLEEIGHDLDHRLNGGKDSAGDEGHAFAALLLTGNAGLTANQERGDHHTLRIDGREVAVEAASGLNIAQIHYVPIPEGDIQSALKGIAGSGKVSGNIQTVVALSATGNGTVVVYDHWEDGYETDIDNPVQSTTKVWGYNNGEWFNDANGNGIRDAGETLAANGTTIVANGATLVLKNAVNPASPNTVDFDGRDKIGSSKAISVTRAGWSNTPGTVLAGAVNLLDAGNAGKVYTLPIGQDLGIAKYFKEGDNGATATGIAGPTGKNGLFEYTSAHIMATQDNTVVKIDKDGNGTFDLQITLNEGQSYFVNGGLMAGARIEADKGVGVYVIAGDVGSAYENRWVTLTPDEQWSSSYYAPVSTTLTSNPSTVVLYNPDTVNAITVHYETAGSTGSITVAAGGSAGFLMPASAAHFYTQGSGGNAAPKFFAVGVIDADATDNATHDWSYSLIPESYLTDRAVVAWAPGADNVSRAIASGDKNGSPVWVTPTENTVLWIDSTTVTVKDGAGKTIAGTVEGGSTKYVLSKLQSYRVSDSDKDQSGLVMYTRDGTLITAAWGEDPSIAGTGAPYLDMGTAVTPYPDYVLTKTSAEAKTADYGGGVSDDDDKIELGEEVVYTVRLTNRAVIDLYNIKLTDTIEPADSAEYVAGSTVLTVYDSDGKKAWTVDKDQQTFFDADGNITSTDTSVKLGGSDFPLAGAGYSINDLNPSTPQIDGLKRGAVVEIQYRVKIRSDINKTLADGDYTITNSVRMEGDGGVVKDKENKTKIDVPVTDGEVFFMKSDFSEAAVSYEEGNTIGLRVVDGDQSGKGTLTVLVTNVTTGEKETVTLTETGPSTGIFQGTLATDNSDTTDDNGTLKITLGDNLKVEYVDPLTGKPLDADGNPDPSQGFDTPDAPGITGDYLNGNSNRKTAVIAAAPPPAPTDGLVEFWDKDFTTNQPNFKEGDVIGIQVDDLDQSTDPNAPDTLTVVVTNTTTGEKETVVLTETGDHTGTFRGTLPTGTGTVGGNEDGTLKMSFRDAIKVEYTDPITGATTDNPATPQANQNTDTFVATKIKTLYLSSDGSSGDASGDLDRIDPVYTADGTTDTTIELASGLVMIVGSDSAQTANGASLSFGHDPSAGGDNKMLLVAVAVGNTGSTGTPPHVTGVTFGGVAMTLVESVTSGGTEGGSDANVRIFLYRLDNPGDVSQTVTATLTGAGSIVAGAVTFQGVNIDNPLSEVVTKRSTGNATSNSLTINSNSNEVIFGVGAWDESGSLTIPASQTEVIKSSGGYVTSAISTQPGASTVTHGYSGGPNQDHALLAVAIRPSNFAAFTQNIAVAEDLKLPEAGVIRVVTHVEEVTGLVSGNTYSINATLGHGGSTIDLGDAYYDADAKTLTWTHELSGDVTIAAGSKIQLTVANNEPGSRFKLDYDSQTAPSRIDLPTTTVINFADVDGDAANGVQSIGFYDKPYGDAASKPIADGTATAGQTVYVRVKVSDPFGDYDVSGLDLHIDGPDTEGDIGPLSLNATHVVDGAGDRYKIYEYAWTTINNTGNYTVTATAHEGSEGINVTVTEDVSVTARDQGTPSITEFITGLGGNDAGDTYTPGHDAFLRITDKDEAGKGTVKARVNGIEVTLTETSTPGVFEADLSTQNPLFDNLPSGTVLTATYKDIDDPDDTSGDSIRVPTPGNNPPVATDQARTITKDGTATGTNLVTSNEGSGTDSDADADPLTVIAIDGDSEAVGNEITLPSGAKVTVNADGTYTYDPNGAFNHLTTGQSATDNFTYTIGDGKGGTDTATVTITLNGNNTATIGGDATVRESGLIDDSGSEIATGTIAVQNEGGIKSVTIGGETFTLAELNDLANVDVNRLTIDTPAGRLVITGFTPGAVSPSDPAKLLDGTIAYAYTLETAQTTPGKDKSTETIALVVTDDSDATANGSLLIHIIDDKPTAAADTAAISRGTSTVGGAAFTNDRIGADGAAAPGPVTGIHAGGAGVMPSGNVSTSVTGTYGAIVVGANGQYTYTLNNDSDAVKNLKTGDAPLTDTFTYTITDADGDTSTATITITINGLTPNAVPTARDDAFETKSGTPVGGSLTGNDTLGDGAPGQHTWSKTGDPANGTVTVNPDGSFTYTPRPGFSGTDSFTYTVTDKDGDKSTATVTITVNGVPVAVDDNVTTKPGTPVSGNLGGNDTPSPDGGNVWSKTSDPANGTVTVSPDGSYTYTPAPDFSGTDSFTYTVTDKDGDKSTATVIITIDAGGGQKPGEGEVDKPNPDNPELVDPNANGQRNVPPAPPLSLQPAEPGEGMRLQPEAPLQSRNVFDTSPVVLDAGPYFAGERHDNVRRMNLPFHPIVYVNREVVVAQQEREPDDARLFSRPGMATAGDVGLRSLGMGLGQDSNLFVVHSVRDSQQQAGFLGSTVDGRLGRVQLNSDTSLPGPDLGQPGAGAPADATEPAEADNRAAADEAAPRAEADDEADEALAAAAAPDFPRVAPSFAEQLRGGAGRLPLAARRT